MLPKLYFFLTEADERFIRMILELMQQEYLGLMFSYRGNDFCQKQKEGFDEGLEYYVDQILSHIESKRIYQPHDPRVSNVDPLEIAHLDEIF
jgi:hypothetical protein